MTTFSRFGVYGLFALGLGLLVACGQTASESFTDKVRDAAAEEAFTGPALWRVADEDTVIYLFGTVHTLRADTRWETQSVQAALEAADAVYFEADVVSPQAQNDITRAVTQLGLYTDGRTLGEILPAAAEKEVEDAARLLGLRLQNLYNYKPWLASLQLSNIHLESRKFDTDLGVEKIIGAQANRRGIPIRYLETGAYQLGLLASVPEAEQIAMLVQTAEQIEDDPDFLDKLIIEWAEGDVPSLADMIADDDVFGSGEVYNLMLRTRNANWSDQIAALLQDEAGTFFIAVGAAHLAGEDSVQALLGASGIQATRENPRKLQ